MKKTLLSVIAGLAVIGSATAVPSMGVQQKNCEDGQHVWVEKTKTCVPINPCLSDDADIKRAYCIEYTFDDFRITEGLARKVIEKYFEDYLPVTEVKFLKSNNSFGVIYDNGNYVEIEFLYLVSDLSLLDFTGLACAAVTKEQPVHNTLREPGTVFCTGAHDRETCRKVYEFGKELGSGRTNAMAIWDDLDKKCRLEPFAFDY